MITEEKCGEQQDNLGNDTNGSEVKGVYQESEQLYEEAKNDFGGEILNQNIDILLVS